MAEIAARESRKLDLSMRLAQAEAAIDAPAVREKATARLENWRGVLMGNTLQARLVLRKLITQPMTVDAEADRVVLTGKAN
jgi:hypothetical protein